MLPVTNKYKTKLPGHLDKYVNNMKARLARRQLAKVTNEGLIEYALQVILIFRYISYLQFSVREAILSKKYSFFEHCSKGL